MTLFSRVADKAYPGEGPFFRSDAERRRFLQAMDMADRSALLSGQRWRWAWWRRLAVRALPKVLIVAGMLILGLLGLLVSFQ